MTKGLRVKTLTFSGSPSSIYNLIFRLASLELPISVLPCGRFGSFCWLKEADAAPGWAGLPSKGREGTGKGNSFSSSPPRILMRRGHRGLGFLSSALKLFPFITEFGEDPDPTNSLQASATQTSWGTIPTWLLYKILPVRVEKGAVTENFFYLRSCSSFTFCS